MLFPNHFDKNKKFIHWTNHFTTKDRYPKVFHECTRIIDKEKKVRALSFGCSTGEECSTIRKFFPNSDIIGVEINDYVRYAAEIKNPHPNTKYISCLNDECDFDLIFCMSVFLKIAQSPSSISGFDRNRVSQKYHFKHFERELENLVKRLKVGGLISIYNSHYRFGDTKFFSNFIPIRQIIKNTIEESGVICKFDKKGKPVEPYKDCIFIKKS